MNFDRRKHSFSRMRREAKRAKKAKKAKFQAGFCLFCLFASTSPLTAGGSIQGAMAHFYSARSASIGFTRVTRRAGR
jgi:hypothetical protein